MISAFEEVIDHHRLLTFRESDKLIPEVNFSAGGFRGDAQASYPLSQVRALQLIRQIFHDSADSFQIMAGAVKRHYNLRTFDFN